MSSKKQNIDKHADASCHWSGNLRTKEGSVENPRENDVLFGRGAPFIRWKGNVRFRHLVNRRKGEFLASRGQVEKNAIVREIIDEIQNNLGGQFLIKHEEVGKPGIVWVPADKHLVFEKVKQLLRHKHQKATLLDEESEGPIEKKRKPATLPKSLQRSSSSQSSRFDRSNNDVLDKQADGPSSRLNAFQQSNRPSFQVPTSAVPISVIPTHGHQGSQDSSFNIDRIDDNRQHELEMLLRSARSEGESIYHSLPSQPPREESISSQELRRQLALRRHVEEAKLRTHRLELELRRRRIELQLLYGDLHAASEEQGRMNSGFSRPDSASLSIPHGIGALTGSSATVQQDLLQNRVRQILTQQEPRMTGAPSAFHNNPRQLGGESSWGDIWPNSSSGLEALRWQRDQLQPPRITTESFLQNQGGEYIPLESLLQRQHSMGAVPNSMRLASLPSEFPRDLDVDSRTGLLSFYRNMQSDETQSKRSAKKSEEE